MFNSITKQEQHYFVAFLFGMMDWKEKLAYSKGQSWTMKQPCPVCKIVRTQHGAKKYSVSGIEDIRSLWTKSQTEFEISDNSRPVCEILNYCDPFKCFPIEVMHTLFVQGVVGHFFTEILFASCGDVLNNDIFFVR